VILNYYSIALLQLISKLIIYYQGDDLRIYKMSRLVAISWVQTII